MGAAAGTDPQRVLRDYLVKHGLKASRQRDTIAEVFFNAGGHMRVEELLAAVRKVDPRVSQATVYRTLKLLTDCGLAEPRRFSDGQTRYEASDRGGEHHDHLICTRCGKIVEFKNDRIEVLQEKVAGEHGFTVTHHKMELYGLCADCRSTM
jgi:Fur family transcriptional regulator, ferric uptake regulator